MRTLLLLTLAGCGYEAPVDADAPAFPNTIEGVLLVSGVDDPGPVAMILSSADDPAPPFGTGSPVTFSMVAPDSFTRDSTESAVLIAPFSVSNVPDGRYVLTALMDMDANFHPMVSTLAGATCGDISGAHLEDPAVLSPARILVQGGEIVDGIAVTLGSPIPTERPAFSVTEGFDSIDPADPARSVFHLQSEPVAAEFGSELVLDLSGPIDVTAPNPCDTAMWLHLRDLDGDGLIDGHPAYPPDAGPLDVWPRVYMEYLGEPIDTDDDGAPDQFDPTAGGDAEWSTEALPYFPQLLAFDPTDPAQLGLIGQTVPLTELDVAWPGAAVRAGADGESTFIEDPAEIPAGAWSVTLIAETGQTWTVPNELDTRLGLADLIPPPGLTSTSTPSQGTWVYVE